jgi:Co/Zn/Cd efflux system component
MQQQVGGTDDSAERRTCDVSDDCCQTTVDTSALESRQRRVLIAVLAINAATFAMMVAAALASRSASLLSGALDNFGDALTYALSFAVVGAGPMAKARVALVKGLLIFAAALGVSVQIAWRLAHLDAPVVDTMSVAALLNLLANLACLRLITPYRHGDVNMASAWECSRNDAFEGVAVLVTAGAVWMSGSAWPDLVVAAVLLILFLRSSRRVLGSAWRELARPPGASAGA